MQYRTRTQDDLDQSGIASAITVLAGLWLIVSPGVFGVANAADGAVWNSVIVGIVVAFFAASRFLGAYDRTLSWLNAILGVWMIVSPFVYGYAADTSRMWNSIVTGVIVLALSIWSATAPATMREQEAWSGRGAEPTYFYGMGPGMYGAPRYGGYYGSEGFQPSRFANPEYRGRGPKGYRRSDEHIQDEICDRMVESAELDPTDVDVRVNNGEVVLTGTVGSRHQRRVAEQISDSVVGVANVRNDLRVSSTAAGREMPRRIA